MGISLESSVWCYFKNKILTCTYNDESWNTSDSKPSSEFLFRITLSEGQGQPRHVTEVIVELSSVLIRGTKDDFESSVSSLHLVVSLDQLGGEVTTWT